MISKKIVSWPLDGTLAQESENKVQRAEKMPRKLFFPKDNFILLSFFQIKVMFLDVRNGARGLKGVTSDLKICQNSNC